MKTPEKFVTIQTIKDHGDRKDDSKWHNGFTGILRGIVHVLMVPVTQELVVPAAIAKTIIYM